MTKRRQAVHAAAPRDRKHAFAGLAGLFAAIVMTVDAGAVTPPFPTPSRKRWRRLPAMVPDRAPNWRPAFPFR
ncbi:hypothetical protein QW131_27680 [Roseibium salinum]|nr:hypothetical protein [Roseibium salinum]